MQEEDVVKLISEQQERWKTVEFITYAKEAIKHFEEDLKECKKQIVEYKDALRDIEAVRIADYGRMKLWYVIIAALAILGSVLGIEGLRWFIKWLVTKVG